MGLRSVWCWFRPFPPGDSGTLHQQILKVGKASGPAGSRLSAVKHPDTLHQGTLKDSVALTTDPVDIPARSPSALSLTAFAEPGWIQPDHSRKTTSAVSAAPSDWTCFPLRHPKIIIVTAWAGSSAIAVKALLRPAPCPADTQALGLRRIFLRIQSHFSWAGLSAACDKYRSQRRQIRQR